MKNTLTALYGKFSGSSFSSDVSGRIYIDQAPERVEFPYCVYFVVSGVPDNVFAKKGKEFIVQFSLFSASKRETEITTMFNDLLSLLDETTFSITGHTLIACEFDNLTSMVEEITTTDGTATVKHWAVDFRIVTQEA